MGVKYGMFCNSLYKNGDYVVDDVELNAYYRRDDPDWLVEIKIPPDEK